ncbi:phage tail tube protein [Acuticoccus sp. M5D2P5]|uniref:phage tail tube protein n=1 Tax=Acuticoccus kalidii TaxID=2910977 RepID=UPI001F43C14E|nr:phage tail tube protein [Acuticoccus kalidii]MCF3934349.1 phage tail tube protein [Acuticoccus kalidii]
MPFATGARHGLSYVAESTYGTTPGSPSMLALRHTSSSLQLNKDNFVSNEIRNDRQIEDMRHGTKQVGGDIGIELSYGAFDDILESALFGSWATDVLKAGTAVKSFTMERQFGDIGQYEVFTGCLANTFSLSISPNAMVTGTIGIMGKDATLSGTSLGAPGAAASNPPFDGFSGTLSEGGSAIANVSALELTLDNGITPAFVIGSDVTPQMIAGRSNLTGTLTAYFEDLALLNKFIDETESSLELTLEGASGGDLTITIPRIKYTGGQNPVNSAEEAIPLTMPFQALRSSSDGTNLILTRTPA